jgi:hypothetical protein
MTNKLDASMLLLILCMHDIFRISNHTCKTYWVLDNYNFSKKQHWIQAMEEYNSLVDNHTWDL